MKMYTKIEDRLLEEMMRMDIIDCHEHLPPEEVRLNTPQDVFTLFSHYTRHDLVSAGMKRELIDLGPFEHKEELSLFNRNIPLDRRWNIFKPYWEVIRHGSYARAALLTAKAVYGFDDINDETYRPLSEAVADANTPGIYDRILRRKCNIMAVLTQCVMTKLEAPLIPLMPVKRLLKINESKDVDKLAFELEEEIPCKLDDYLVLTRELLNKWKKEGTVGIKIMSHENFSPDYREGEKLFKQLMSGNVCFCDNDIALQPLHNFLLHEIVTQAAELDLVIAVHAGMWGDYRQLDCKYMLSLAAAHPEARFDLYHLGMPSIRDCIVIAKNLPNVFLNLCWTHIISQVQTCSGIDELLDLVPLNKISAFGGDYKNPVEKIVGHLQMARENFACVLGRRIKNNRCSFEDAIHILHLWFRENPVKLYKLPIQNLY